MADLVYDGKRIFARVVFRLLATGRVIDPAKVLLVDSGAPFTAISASNVDDDLQVIGLTTVSILGCDDLAVILRGGSMTLTVDDRERTCSKPVVYSPCIRTDILGADQIVELGLFPGIAIRPPPPPTPPPPATRQPLPPWTPVPLAPDGFPELEEIIVTATRRPFVETAGKSALVKWLLGRTPLPGMQPVRITPRPGLFSFAFPEGGHMPAQGGYAAASWDIEQRWPDAVFCGELFQVEAVFSPGRDLDFAALTFEPPHGFELVEGEVSRAFPGPRAGEPQTVVLVLRAPPAPGDHFWRTTVRVGEDGGQEAIGVAGRIAVRPGDAEKALA